jgi:hypothetical protein
MHNDSENDLFVNFTGFTAFSLRDAIRSYTPAFNHEQPGSNPNPDRGPGVAA